MKKYKILLVLIALFLYNNVMAQNYELLSPDGSNKLTIVAKDSIRYSLSVNDTLIMNNATLSLTLDNKKILGYDPVIIKAQRNTVQEKLYPEVRVKSQEIDNHYNELVLQFKEHYKLHFRAFNNGMAYRFITSFKKDILVKNEGAIFNFVDGAKSYFPREKEFFSHNERLYEYNALDTLTSKDLASLPILVECSDKIKVLITETGLLDYPGMWVRGNIGNSLKATFPQYVLETKTDRFERWKDDRSTKPTKTEDYIAKTKGNRAFPWRIIAISKSDTDLITNQLSYQLAEKSRIKDTSWIKPGKVAWDWWNDNNIYGVDFEAGVNTKTYKYYIDFASKYGIEYIILDEGWYVLGDVLKIVPEVDVKEIIRYGKTKNVDVILWVAWSSLDQKLHEALDTYKEWGAKGVKVDFMQRDDQWMVKYYERVALESAKRKLLVDFHGSYKPSGLRRTYPNVLTREGVKGAENNKWANYITPSHNITLPFIRMVAGPMDYTPGAMINAQKDNFSISWKRPMSMGTRAHQVAMYVIYESPLQMLCDSPSNYLKEEETTKFIAQIPTVWDETRVLHAKIGDYIALARKNKNIWYVGVMNDETERELQIDLSFLNVGNYTVEIIQDGVNANRYASDYMQMIKQVSNTDVLTAKLASGGGWTAIITHKK